MAFPADWFQTAGAKISACPQVEGEWSKDCGCLDGFSGTLPFCARPRQLSLETEVEIVAGAGWEPLRLKRSELNEDTLLANLRPVWPYPGSNPADPRLPQRPQYGVAHLTYYQPDGTSCTRTASPARQEPGDNPFLPLKNPPEDGETGYGCPANFLSLSQLPVEFRATFHQTGNPPNLYYWPEVETSKIAINDELTKKSKPYLGKEDLLGKYPVLLNGENLGGDQYSVLYFTKTLEHCLKHGRENYVKRFEYLPEPDSIVSDQVLRIKNQEGNIESWRVPARIVLQQWAEGRLSKEALSSMGAVVMKGDRPVSYCAEGLPKWTPDWTRRPKNDAVRWIFDFTPSQIQKDRSVLIIGPSGNLAKLGRAELIRKALYDWLNSLSGTFTNGLPLTIMTVALNNEINIVLKGEDFLESKERPETEIKDIIDKLSFDGIDRQVLQAFHSAHRALLDQNAIPKGKRIAKILYIGDAKYENFSENLIWPLSHLKAIHGTDIALLSLASCEDKVFINKDHNGDNIVGSCLQLPPAIDSEADLASWKKRLKTFLKKTIEQKDWRNGPSLG